MYKVQNKIARTSSWSSYNFFLKSFHYRVKLKIQSCKNLFPSNQPLHCENIFPLTTPNISGIVLVLISWTFVQTEKRVELHKNKLLMFKKKSVTLSLQNHAHDYGFGFTLWRLNKWKRTFNSNYSNIVNIWIPVKNWSTFKTCDNSWYRRLKHPPLLMDLSHISVSSIIIYSQEH